MWAGRSPSSRETEPPSIPAPSCVAHTDAANTTKSKASRIDDAPLLAAVFLARNSGKGLRNERHSSYIEMHKRLFDRFLVDTMSACNSPGGPAVADADLKSEVATSAMDLSDDEVKKIVQDLGSKAFSSIAEQYKGAASGNPAPCH